MLRNYIITAFRSFKKNKTYTLINILGLSLGIACCFIQFAIVHHELSFDRFHENSESIFRVVEHQSGDNGMNYGAWLPNPMGYTIEEEVSGAAVIPIQGPLEGTVKIQDGDDVKLFSEEYVLFANGNLLRHMTFPVVKGVNPSTLDEPNKVMLTESISRKYFGGGNPIGKFITYANIEMEVTGVLKDVPYNSTVRFDILVSYSTIKKIYPDWISNWGAYWQGTSYVKVENPESIKNVEMQITQVAKSHLDKENAEATEYFLQPLAEVHTNAQYANGPNYILPKDALLASGLTVLMILVVSVFNFINLSTSQAIKRSKEIGIRKTLGSRKINLIAQFLLETFIIVSIAGILALTLSQFFINWLNETVSDLPIRLAFDGSIAAVSIGLTFVVTALAGIYPATVLARFNPIQAIKNQASLSHSVGSFSLRKMLIVAQFTVANLLVAITIIASAQMAFIKNKDLGFDADNIILMNFSDKPSAGLETIKHDFESFNFVEKATWCMGPPQTGWSWSSSYNLLGEPTNDALYTNLRFVDGDYLSTFNIPLLAGRNIQTIEYPDSAQRVLVNEEFVSRLGLSPAEAVGRHIAYNGSFEGTIEGVVKNFHISKLQQAIPPAMLAYQPGQMNAIALKVTKGNVSDYRDDLQIKYQSYDQEGVFNPRLLSTEIAKTYFLEDLVFSSFRMFSLLAIAISLMGLYGLVNFMIAKNRKNISIKKIFGASSKILLASMSKEYFLLLAIAFIISTPVCIMLMNDWLNDFYYHIEISWSHFAFSFMAILVVAALTVAYKSYQVVVENPVEALRSE